MRALACVRDNACLQHASAERCVLQTAEEAAGCSTGSPAARARVACRACARAAANRHPLHVTGRLQGDGDATGRGVPACRGAQIEEKAHVTSTGASVLMDAIRTANMAQARPPATPRGRRILSIPPNSPPAPAPAPPLAIPPLRSGGGWHARSRDDLIRAGGGVGGGSCQALAGRPWLAGPGWQAGAGQRPGLTRPGRQETAARPPLEL